MSAATFATSGEQREGAAHTPGPWHVFSHSWCNTSVLADGFEHGICSLDINHATEESQESDEALMAANARLIAAAPALLAACKLWAAYQQAIDSDDPAISRPLAAYSDAMDATLAAIALATKESE